jgi:hypothetical protein
MQDYGDQEFSSESDVEDSDTEVDCHEGSSGNSDNSDEDNEEESSKSCSAVLEFAAESVEEYKQRVLLQVSAVKSHSNRWLNSLPLCQVMYGNQPLCSGYLMHGVFLCVCRKGETGVMIVWSNKALTQILS